jgi:mono/diheme cytochrome c family protein
MFLYACVDQKLANEPNVATNKRENEPDHPGRVTYLQYCLSCHMHKGEGVPGLYPPLRKTETIAGGVNKLVEIIVKGQEGAIIVNGEPYNNIMTKLDFLSDQQIAEVLSYVRSNFGNDYPPILIEEVKEARESLTR